MPIYKIERVLTVREIVWIQEDSKDGAISRAYDEEGKMRQKKESRVRKVTKVEEQ